MNIEIANRLVNLRKENSLSQEALAEKLGISRQAVSKWERAEASPDTDNLILLAKLYGVSLDELLRTEDEIPMQIQEEQPEVNQQEIDAKVVTTRNDREDEYVHIGLEGVHVKDKDGSEVHVGWDGIHVDDTKKGDNVYVDKSGVYVNGRKYENPWFGVSHFPFSMCMVVLFIISGIVFCAWHPGWVIFLTIPLYYPLAAYLQRGIRESTYDCSTGCYADGQDRD